MTGTPDLWEVRQLPGGLALELTAGAVPALILVQGNSMIRIELTRVKDPGGRRLPTYPLHSKARPTQGAGFFAFAGEAAPSTKSVRDAQPTGKSESG